MSLAEEVGHVLIEIPGGVDGVQPVEILVLRDAPSLVPGFEQMTPRGQLAVERTGPRRVAAADRELAGAAVRL